MRCMKGLCLSYITGSLFYFYGSNQFQFQLINIINIVLYLNLISFYN